MAKKMEKQRRYPLNVCDKLNFHEKLDVLEKTLNNWKRRKLTLLGKVNIVKSVGLSKLISNASVLPAPENFCGDDLTKREYFGKRRCHSPV